MNKKAFTLIEMLAVIIILGVLTSLVMPSILKMMKGSKEKTYDVLINNINDSALLYASRHKELIKSGLEINGFYEVTLNDLLDEGLIKTPLIDPRTDEEISLTKKVIIINNLATLEVLVVGGGGGGGGGESQNSMGGGGGGGGGGGLIYESNFPIYQTTYSVVVGLGGTGGSSAAADSSSSGTNGYPSSFSTLIAEGGGGGGGDWLTGLSGGSGGGTGGDKISVGGSSIYGQGNNGGSNGGRAGGGGGGAGSSGINGNSIGGNGGAGLMIPISGSSVYYAGGGGGGAGGSDGGTAGGVGGTGGGGAGSCNGDQSGNGTCTASNGTANTGGGGGGEGSGNGTSRSGGNGGSGIVIIRYPGEPKATGGNITSSDGHTIHTFTSSGTLSFQEIDNNLSACFEDEGCSDEIADKLKPVITISGNNPENVYKGSPYVDAGATAIDNEDGDITSNISVTSNVNINNLGSYTVTYTVSDSNGHTAVSTRTVNVICPLDYNCIQNVNKPALSTGMTPIKWVNGVEQVTTANDSDWYNYSRQLWANAKTADGSYWVWIPRYAYKITSGYQSSTAGTIDVKFLYRTNPNTYSGETVSTFPTYNGNAQTNYVLHPAFNFGGTQVSGIWVAKFEASNNGGKIKIVPDVVSWRNINIANIYNNIRSMETDTLYGWNNTGSGIDTHLMKNIEWGVVAYLYYSNYGKYGNTSYIGSNKEIYLNNSTSFITGRSMGAPGGSGIITPTNEYITEGYYTYDGKCATIHANLPAPCNSGSVGQNLINKSLSFGATTTGNITGIYDMSGGSWEYVMANLDNIAGSSGLNPASIPDKYIDRYSNTFNYGYSNIYFGDSFYETSYNAYINNSIGNQNGAAWYTDYSCALNSTLPWIDRGGDFFNNIYAGQFSFYCRSGDAANYSSFRPVLIVGTGL